MIGLEHQIGGILGGKTRRIDMEEIRKSYYAIIPADVRYDKDLTPNAKLLYAEITSLCNEKGYCWATNKYFAELYNVTIISVSKWVRELQEKGYIESQVVYAENTKQIIGRHITLPTLLNKNLIPIKEKFNIPIKEKFNNNNKDFNNKKEYRVKFTPPTLEEVKEYAKSKQRLDIAERFYDFFTEGNWSDSKGNKVKNWKQKFLTWCSYGNSTIKDKNFKGRQYEEKEINAMFSNLDDIEV